MIFNILVLLILVMVAAYLANQGTLSAILIFISASFASVLAGALFEPLHGVLAKPTNIWFAPDAFTLAIWDAALGKAMGGNREFSAVHPDLATESYGYRNVVQYSVQTSLHPDLFKALAAYTTEDTKRFNIA